MTDRPDQAEQVDTRLRPELRDAAFRWIAGDPDRDDRAELQRVLAGAMAGFPEAVAELADRMAAQPRFGTAGLRGRVRAGSNGMNRAVVVRATAGLAGWLAANGMAGGTVVVGRDARHRSEQFCAAAAGVLVAAGFDVRVLPRPLPTPVLAFAVRRLGAAAGVQITASHNPPADNGYKVYLDLGDGVGAAQIVAPVDARIEAAIAAAPAAVEVSTGTGWQVLGDELVDAYLDRVAGLPSGTDRELRVVVTPLHGVGGATVLAALRRAGFADVHLVAEQAEPDPDFGTVPFPNPEEPGATDLLLAAAAELGADLAIALDPDADRCALGVLAAGGWRMLSGDQTGALLGEHVLATMDRTANPEPLVATTIVSSSLLGDIAAANGARYRETLTGFKWIVRAGDGAPISYGYEEALGLCVDPDAVADKDGISAAVLAADLAATLKASGRTLPDRLDELAVRHGLHLTGQLTVPLAGSAAAAMAAVRANLPATLDGREVDAEDLLPRTDGVRLAADGLRVVVRPSGTEPKLKAYLQVVEPVAAPAELAAATGRGSARMAALRAEVSALLAG